MSKGQQIQKRQPGRDDEIRQLKDRISELEGLLIAVGGGGNALLAERTRDKRTIEHLTEAVTWFRSCLPTRVIRGEALTYQTYNPDQPGINMLNLPVGVAIFIRTGPGIDDVEALPSLETIYQGSKAQFIAEVPLAIMRILSGIPTMDDAGSPPVGMEIETLLETLHTLAQARLVSHEEYLAKKLAAFNRYMETHPDSKFPHLREKQRPGFYNFFDLAFKRQDERINSSTAPFVNLTKSVRKKGPQVP